jgi:HSF-type DNA-binding
MKPRSVQPRTVNFYSFRKIKYGDDIRIDPEEEKRTSKYWRFYHEKFRKGHPEWLVHVKRTVTGPRKGSSSAASSGGSSPTPSTSGTSALPSSSGPVAATAAAVMTTTTTTAAVVENQQLKTEVTSLKERIDAMTKNIDQLTTMVQQVTLKKSSDEDDNDSQDSDDRSSRRRRRPRKVVVLNSPMSTTAHIADVAMPDISEAFGGSLSSRSSSTGVHSLMPPAPRSAAVPTPTPFDFDGRVPSESELSDEGFVDQLFTAFKDTDAVVGGGDDAEDLLDVLGNDSNSHIINDTQSATPTPSMLPAFDEDNRPRVELMKRLSDALSLLPRNIQELIVDRLIQAITSPQEIQDSLQVARALEEVITASSASTTAVSPAPMSVPRDDDQDAMMEDSCVDAEVVPAPTNTPTASPPPSLPLAAATLAALLSQYNQKQQKQQQQAQAAAAAAGKNGAHDDDDDHHDVVAAKEAQRKSKESAAKSLLIPVHA